MKKALLVIILICIGTASAQIMEPFIHQFYGTVTGAPDSTLITAQISGKQFQTTTSNFRYGYSPNIFYVEGPATGTPTIQFLINNTVVATRTFAKYTITQLNLPYTGTPVSVNCNDGLKGIGETDIDCGDQCPPCGYNKICVVDSDCQSDNCVNGRCDYPLHCFNFVKDGTETDLNCGGECGPCDNGKSCLVNSDCKSAYCTGGICQTRPQPRIGGGGGGGTGWRRFYYEPPVAITTNITPTEQVCNDVWTCEPWGPCIDGVKKRECWFNDDPTCEKLVAEPAREQICEVYKPPAAVKEPTCYDGIQNQGETGIDCGGPCPPCYIEMVPEPRKISPWVWASIPFFLLIVGLIAWLILKSPKITEAGSYAKTALKQGYSKQEVADKLREAGYTDKEVTDAFRKAVK